MEWGWWKERREGTKDEEGGDGSETIERWRAGGKQGNNGMKCGKKEQWV